MLVALAGCAGFQFPMSSSNAASRPVPPNISVASVTLAHAPSNNAIGRTLCDRATSSFACNLLGPRPSAADMKFVFDVELDIENTNRIPLPVTSALAAFTAFPEASGQQNLGAVCMSLCEDPASCPQTATNACESTEPEIRDVHDFANAAANLLVAVAMGRDSLSNLRIRTVAPGAHTRVVFRLELNPEQVLGLVQQVATDAVPQLIAGQDVALTIPYQIEGSIWITVEHFGRFAVNIPAYRNSWTIR